MGRQHLAAAAMAALMGCGGPSGSADRTPAGADVEVEVVGPGVISTDLPEFAAAVSRGGDTIYFNRTPPDRSRLDLFLSVRVEGSWSEARLFEPTRGETAIDPFLSLDGTRLYFSSNRSVDGGQSGSFNIWYVDRAAASGGAPVLLAEPIRSDSSDVFNSFAADGTMVFSSRRNGERRIYASRLGEGSWSDPELLVFGESEVGSNPMISPDGNFMIIAAAGPWDGSDLFVTCRSDEGWGAPLRLDEPINSRFTDFAPGVAGDFLYFTSERPGLVGPQPDSVRPPGDIYRTRIEGVAALCRPGAA